MGVDFEFMPVRVEEKYPTYLKPVEIAEYLSQLKLSPIKMESFPNETIFIACDTIVVINNQVIGKPTDEKDALQMLRKLSSKEHVVISGLTIATPVIKLTSHKQTLVKFKDFSDEELQYYVARYKPLDKAGAYGVQDWLGYVGIDYIQGSFYNVMGLPTKLLWDMLYEIV
jgi:septum formation protein